ncbi:MAG: hypothetical protein WCT12_17710, partial [Verrucomicrobiota bacterium]
MSLLRSWPNPTDTEDDGSASLSFIGCHWPTASDPQRWTPEQAANAHKPQRGDMFIARQNRNLRK